MSDTKEIIEYVRGCITPRDLYPDTWSADGAKRGYIRIRNLVKAGALIAAEIDRLQHRAVAAGEETCQK